MDKQAVFAEPHSSSTIGWVVVGLGLWLGWGQVGVGFGLGLGWVGVVLGSGWSWVGVGVWLGWVGLVRDCQHFPLFLRGFTIHLVGWVGLWLGWRVVV